MTKKIIWEVSFNWEAAKIQALEAKVINRDKVTVIVIQPRSLRFDFLCCGRILNIFHSLHLHHQHFHAVCYALCCRPLFHSVTEKELSKKHVYLKGSVFIFWWVCLVGKFKSKIIMVNHLRQSQRNSNEDHRIFSPNLYFFVTDFALSCTTWW